MTYMCPKCVKPACVLSEDEKEVRCVCENDSTTFTVDKEHGYGYRIEASRLS